MCKTVLIVSSLLLNTPTLTALSAENVDAIARANRENPKPYDLKKNGLNVSPDLNLRWTNSSLPYSAPPNRDPKNFPHCPAHPTLDPRISPYCPANPNIDPGIFSPYAADPNIDPGIFSPYVADPNIDPGIFPHYPVTPNPNPENSQPRSSP